MGEHKNSSITKGEVTETSAIGAQLGRGHAKIADNAIALLDAVLLLAAGLWPLPLVPPLPNVQNHCPVTPVHKTTVRQWACLHVCLTVQ